MMLSRNLLYTGLTRAKQLAFLVGPSKAIGLAVKQVKDTQRYTLLQERLVKRENNRSNSSKTVHESISH